ncbi:hypothetical protein [Sphingobacterium sp. UBA5996]|uniref:hypothetical protein n=1 Tax=Sphingobacterium sp. UBA5996 TaxID=1947505 RepID=UPI0025F2736F|nr:hypothetical protein [Sphingobacterium sp. UBA5996]
MTKNKETKVTDFSGTLVVKVTSYNTNQPAKNIGVVIIPFNNYEYEQYISKNLANAEFKGVTWRKWNCYFRDRIWQRLCRLTL